jgi:hypothetical protein
MKDEEIGAARGGGKEEWWRNGTGIGGSGLAKWAEKKLRGEKDVDCGTCGRGGAPARLNSQWPAVGGSFREG